MFGKLPAETFPKVSMQYKISAVPTFLFFLSGKQVDRLDGANAAKLTQMVKNNVKLPNVPTLRSTWLQLIFSIHFYRMQRLKPLKQLLHLFCLVM